ncbi:MAG: DUF349 domain-containing protein [Bacteroidales bacterium]|jgi:hypothetical protein|nr:DUF349 domain-containing protein [Bacteroidales bacterium]
MTDDLKISNKDKDGEYNVHETNEVQDSATLSEEEVSNDLLPEEGIFADEKEKEELELSTPKMFDYSTLERGEMLEHLRELLAKGDAESVKDEVDAIKYHFYRKMKEEKQQKTGREEKEEEYDYEEDPQELSLKKILNQYREMRNEQREKQEWEKQENLREKLNIIEELKELSARGDSIGENFHLFRQLQARWRSVGLVPQSEVKNLRETYHHCVEVFYDYMKINKELRDLDFKRNLDAKTILCEKTEALISEESSVVKAFHTLQEYHDQWHEIGPVPKEYRVSIWERFKAASVQVNKKHHDYFEKLKETRKARLVAKEALCAQVEEITLRPTESLVQWEKNAKEIITIQKQWNAIGAAAKKDDNKVNRLFQAVCDRFFEQKREFVSQVKAGQEQNLQLKQELCEQAEALKENSDWKAATKEIIQLQKKWKSIGNIPLKYRESLWKRFRTACDYFFEQKTKHFSAIDEQYNENLKIKQGLIQKIRDFTPSEDPEKDLEQLKQFQCEWNETGFVPLQFVKSLQEEYRQAIRRQFDALKVDKSDARLLLYRHKIEQMATTPQTRGKIDTERDRLMRKRQQLQSDLVLWENNIGFFSKSKSSEAAIAGVEAMIAQAKLEVKELENKINLIDSLEN